jgi:magnesium-transporting ATPase (P-type)
MELLETTDRKAQLTAEHLESFAKDGLRTLCLGYRVLTKEEYEVNIDNDILSKDFLLIVRHGQ